jgi:uncharacterized protein YPO0396
MLEQIDSSLTYVGNEEMHDRQKPELLDFQEWLRKEVLFREEQIRRCKERIQERIGRVKMRNDWNAALAKSVPPVFKGR